MKNLIISKIIQFSSVLALAFAVLNINTLCSATGHQPKAPASAMRFKK